MHGHGYKTRMLYYIAPRLSKLHKKIELVTNCWTTFYMFLLVTLTQIDELTIMMQ